MPQMACAAFLSILLSSPSVCRFLCFAVPAAMFAGRAAVAGRLFRVEVCVYGACSGVVHGRYGRKRLHGGVFHGVERHKCVEQGALPALANAVDLVEYGEERIFLPQAAMVGDGKAVRLVADALQQVQCGAVAGQFQRQRLSGLIDQLVRLREADARDERQPRLVQHLHCHVELGAPAVDDEQVGETVKAGAAALETCKAPGQRFAHGHEVVAFGFRADPEPPVGLPVRLAVGEHDHGRHGVAPLDVRVVKAFQPGGDALQPQHAGQLRQRAFAALPRARLQGGVLFERVHAVAIGQPGKLGLVAALRHVPGVSYGRRAHRARRRWRPMSAARAVQQDLRRERGHFQIVLLEEGGEDLRGRLAGVRAHMEFFRADHLAVADKERKYQHVVTQAAERKHVRHVLVCADDHLLVVQRFDGADAVAQRGGTLKLERRGGLLHLGGELMDDGFRVPREEGANFIEHRMIGLPCHIAGARGAALAHMVHQARALPARHGALQVFFAVAYGKVFAHDVHAVAQRDAGQERAQVTRAVLAHAADDLHARKVLPVVDAHIGEVLVVLEQDVVLGLDCLMRLDSSVSASVSFEVRRISKSATWLTMARTLGVWLREDWKYWRTRFFSDTALPT